MLSGGERIKLDSLGDQTFEVQKLFLDLWRGVENSRDVFPPALFSNFNDASSSVQCFHCLRCYAPWASLAGMLLLLLNENCLGKILSLRLIICCCSRVGGVEFLSTIVQFYSKTDVALLCKVGRVSWAHGYNYWNTRERNNRLLSKLCYS